MRTSNSKPSKSRNTREGTNSSSTIDDILDSFDSRKFGNRGITGGGAEDTNTRDINIEGSGVRTSPKAHREPRKVEPRRVEPRRVEPSGQALRVEPRGGEHNSEEPYRNPTPLDDGLDYDEDDEATGFCDEDDLDNQFTYQDVIDEMLDKGMLNLSQEDDYGDSQPDGYEDDDSYDESTYDEEGSFDDGFDDGRRGIPVKVLVGLGVILIVVSSVLGVKIIKGISSEKKASDEVVEEATTTVDDLQVRVDRLYTSDEKKDIRSGVYMNDLNELYDMLDGLADSEKDRDSYNALYDELNTISAYMVDKDMVTSMGSEDYDLNTSGLVSNLEGIKSNAASNYTVPGLVLSINSLCDAVNDEYDKYFSLKNELSTVKVEDFNPDDYKSRISAVKHTVNKKELKDLYDKLVASKKVLDAKTEEEKQAAEAERLALEEAQEKAKKAAEASQKKAEKRAKEAEEKLAELQEKVENSLSEEKEKSSTDNGTEEGTSVKDTSAKDTGDTSSKDTSDSSEQGTTDSTGDVEDTEGTQFEDVF